MTENAITTASTAARWSSCRTTMMSYVVPPLAVPIFLALALFVFSYAIN
jgi:hypothetical protein